MHRGLQRCAKPVQFYACTTGAGAEAMAQESSSACVAAAAVDMEAKRMESMHTFLLTVSGNIAVWSILTLRTPQLSIRPHHGNAPGLASSAAWSW